jgi:hypothetical protein
MRLRSPDITLNQILEFASKHLAVDVGGYGCGRVGWKTDEDWARDIGGCVSRDPGLILGGGVRVDCF